MTESLEKVAVDEGTTVKALTNSILGRYCDWDKKAREFGFTLVPMSILTRLVKMADDEEMARMGREVVFSTWKEMAEFWFSDSTPDKILDALNLRSKFDPNTLAKVTREGEAYTIIFHHELGPKYSIALENALQELVRQSFHVEPRISMGDSVVTAHFKVSLRKLPA